MASVTALGMIETIGLVSAIEAADAGLKAAQVRLLGTDYVRGGLVMVRFEGTGRVFGWRNGSSQ